ncbi:MAG: hypothetical protein ACT4PZ_21865 [Panacagrimonas sp.]
MFSIMRVSRRALLGLTLGFPLVQAHAVDAVGSTAGQFAVQSGAASYSIPLSLPPGLGEMKPELSLV